MIATARGCSVSTTRMPSSHRGASAMQVVAWPTTIDIVTPATRACRTNSPARSNCWRTSSTKSIAYSRKRNHEKAGHRHRLPTGHPRPRAGHCARRPSATPQRAEGLVHLHALAGRSTVRRQPRVAARDQGAEARVTEPARRAHRTCAQQSFADAEDDGTLRTGRDAPHVAQRATRRHGQRIRDSGGVASVRKLLLSDPTNNQASAKGARKKGDNVGNCPRNLFSNILVSIERSEGR